MNNAPYRVARIITRLNIGGPSIQAIDLSRELTAGGFETTLIHGHLADGEGDMTQLLPLGSTHSVYVNDLVRPISPLRDWRAFWKIYRALRACKPDIVHTHMAKAGSLGRLAAVLYNRRSKQKARLLHTYHGHVFDGYFGSPTTRVFLMVERFLGRRTDALVAISPEIARDLIETYAVARKEQVRVIPLGFNLDRFVRINPDDRARARAMFSIPADAIVVSTVGRLTAIKQHSLFLAMAARLAKMSDRFRFLIVGDGELRSDLEKQTTELGLTARVHFAGWRGDLENVYGATDVFVLTSRNEGTPVALIEAMASSVASVSTDVGGVKDVMTGPQFGSLVPFGDSDALAAAVSELADDAARRRSIGDASRAWVRDRFHAARLQNDIKSLYWQLLANGGTISDRPPA